jgi:membrane protein CcdC involved in cytochrome C biogenesis
MELKDSARFVVILFGVLLGSLIMNCVLGDSAQLSFSDMLTMAIGMTVIAAIREKK